jgi:hypothetical protein
MEGFRRPLRRTGTLPRKSSTGCGRLSSVIKGSARARLSNLAFFVGVKTGPSVGNLVVLSA